MANPHVAEIKRRIENKLGELRREGDGRSLFRAASADVLFYFRYSKILRAPGKVPYAFYGLRSEDVKRLRGNNAFLCFVTDKADSDVFLLPFARFEHLLRRDDLADDGQFKVNMYFRPGGVQALFSKQGSYAVDAYCGLDGLSAVHGAPPSPVPADMTHGGMQSILGDIGMRFGFDLWFPRSDIGKIRRDIVESGRVRDRLPSIGGEADRIMQEIDVIWLDGPGLVSLFEVEHTTSIFSGLLRLCDVSLTYAKANDCRIVARQVREAAFHREMDRPTFREHKLTDKVLFMTYANAWSWLDRLDREQPL